MDNNEVFLDQDLNRRHHQPGGIKGVWWGLLLVFVGAVLFFQQLGFLGGGFNWWAMFIFLPAIGSLNAAWTAFRRNDGVFTAGVRSALGGGLIVLTVAILLLFDMDWSIWWPLMLVMPGFAIFLNGMVGFGSQDRTSGRWVLRMGIWTGLAVMLLGWIFLLDKLGVFSLRETFSGFGWWGVVVLIPGLGALYNALRSTLEAGRLNAAAISLVVVGFSACAVAAVAILGLGWNLLMPIILIGSGSMLLASGFIRR